MDNFLYEISQEVVDTVGPMVDKEVLYVMDQNGGSYNGQIQIDTSVLANSGKWLAYSEAYLEIPFMVSMKSSSNIGGDATYTNGFMVGLKNGYYQLIDSIQVDYNNTNVVQLQPYTNFYVNYKLLSTLSKDSVNKWGDAIGFCPDSAGSFRWSAGASADGDGISNNRVYKDWSNAPLWSSEMDQVNEGFLRRLKNNGIDLGVNPAGVGYGAIPNMVAVGSANTIRKNHFTNSGSGSSANGVYQWNLLATIRLKDLCDFFDKMPLVKGAFLRFTINYNSFRATATTVAVGPTIVHTSLTQLSGRTNPMMVSSSLAGNPLNLSVANGGGGVFSLECGVAGTSNPASTVTPMNNSCRLYVPAYALNPARESQYISLHPTKTITYTDIYNYNLTSIGASSSFNSILTNGIVNAKSVVLIPMMNNVAGNYATQSLTPYQSLFDSAPGTTAPLSSLTNLQIQVSGQNVWQQNVNYDYEMFLNEVASMNALNGGASDELTSGLIGRFEWDNGYRFYVADISRRLPSEDSVPKSVVVSGTNNSAKIIDLICFITFERKITIDLLTGQIVA